MVWALFRLKSRGKSAEEAFLKAVGSALGLFREVYVLEGCLPAQKKEICVVKMAPVAA